MDLKKGAPGEGGETPRVERFSYINPAPGLAKVFTGWLAAEPYWCKAHEHTKATPGTKPCLDWMTDGAVPCKRCRNGHQKTDICYVHLYREVDMAPLLVIVHDSAADLLFGLGFGSQVMVGRMEGQSSVFVKPAPVQAPWKTNLEHRKRTIDVAVSLCGLWRMPELDEWRESSKRRRASVNPADLPGRLRLSVPTPTTPTEAVAVDAERKSDGWDELVNQTLGRAQKRARDAERNGKHPPE